MRNNRTGGRREQGSVLISAIAFAAIIALLVAGIATFTVSHYARATREGDYAAALNLAEAGINWELRQLSMTGNAGGTNQDGSSCSGLQASPCVRSVTYPSGASTVTVPGTFSVYVTNDYNTSTGTWDPNWSPPSPLAIWSTGTVNGVSASVSRTVRIRGKLKSIFDEYALFGVVDTTFNGSFTVDGTFGSNGPITVKGGSGVVYGNFVFNGYPTGTIGTGITLGWIGGGQSPPYGPYGTVTHQPDQIVWPLVSDVADKAAVAKAKILGIAGPALPGGGLAWFKAHNDNASIQVFDPTDATKTDPSTHAWAPISELNQWGGPILQDQKGLWVMGGQSFTSVLDNNPMDTAGNSPMRYAFPTTYFNYVNPVPNQPFQASAVSLTGKATIILPGFYSTQYNPSNPPAEPHYQDYYFENINLTANQRVLVDTARGPIRVWLNASTSDYQAKDDAISANGQPAFIFTTNTTVPIVTTATSPAVFRIYDNKGIAQGNGSAGVLNLPGGAFFPGGVYDYNGTLNSQVQFGGGTIIYGSVIAGGFGANGNPLIKFPNNGNGDPQSDWSLWWGFRGNWVELNGAY